jgi:hypothetical protein
VKRREFITLLGSAAATWPVAARGQQPERMRRIGVLMSTDQDRSYRDPLPQQRRGERGPVPKLLPIGRPFRKFCFSGLQIGYVDNGPIDYGSPGYPVAVCRSCVSDCPLT